MTYIEFELYFILTMCFWLFFCSVMIFYYNSENSPNDASIWKGLMWTTPFIPIVLPLGVLVCLAGGLLWFLFLYIPDSFKNKEVTKKSLIRLDDSDVSKYSPKTDAVPPTKVDKEAKSYFEAVKHLKKTE